MKSTRVGLVLTASLACGGPVVAEPGGRCDRACLEGFVDRYLDAVVAHDPAQAPLAPAVRFTENGQRLRPGDGLWNTASARGPYKLYVADAEAGHVGFFGTIRENGKPAILALRLAIVEGEITEAETLVARSEEGARQVEALGNPHPLFSAAAAPMPREALVRTANLYFVGLERNDGKGVYPFTDDCDRIENGKQTTNRPADPKGPVDVEALGCRQQFETGFFRFVTRIRDRRFVVLDPERGLCWPSCSSTTPATCPRSP